MSKLLLQKIIFGILFFSSAVFAEELGLPLHGFADASGGFSSRSTPIDQRISGFKLGTVDLYLTPEFDDKVKSLIEIAFEPDRGTGGINLDVERLQLGYTVTNNDTIWFGRFHTPFGVWNNAYHHGSQLQTSIYRPKFIDFEDAGGIVPAHSVGIWDKGIIRLKKSRINYNTYLVNGSRTILDGTSGPGALDMNNYRNDKNNFMVGGTISSYHDLGITDSFEIGLHGFLTTINSYNGDTYDLTAVHSTDVKMFGGFFSFNKNNWELLSEYYGFYNKDKLVSGAPLLKSHAAFAQFTYNINSIYSSYFRAENSSLNQNDSYFKDQLSGRSYTRYSLGFKKNINSRAAFKLEFLHTSKDENLNPYNIVQYSYAIRF